MCHSHVPNRFANGMHMEDRNLGRPGHPELERRRSAATAPTKLKPVVAKALNKPSGRLAAIRNTLPTLATYRSWSAKARTDWDEKK
jgi:hypothetical protein